MALRLYRVSPSLKRKVFGGRQRGGTLRREAINRQFVSLQKPGIGPQSPTDSGTDPKYNMKTNFIKINWLTGLALGALLFLGFQPASAADKLKALIVDGQNNHDWRTTTPILQAALESSGRFTVDVATSPRPGQSMEDFKPDFSKYSVIILNYNGEIWPAATKAAFEGH